MKKALHRSICLLLALSMVLGIGLIPNGLGVATQAGAVTVQAAQESILADNIQDGCTLQCWNWSLENIEANLGLIANMGYTSIQISPMQETKEPTASRPYSNWWVMYQPVSFNINEQATHAIGTKEELISLCEAAHKYDIKVIMDVVCNHMANDGANVLSSLIQQDILSDPNCWHDYTVNSWDYSSRYNITQYCMSGLPDLNTANARIQNYCLELLKSYIDCGVDGFRFDGAKQIETPLDDSTFASNFWPTVVNGATSYARETRSISLYCYGEILGGTDDNDSLDISAYTDYMSVTDSVWGNDVRYRIDDNNAGGLQTGYFKNCNADKLVLWGESHDTYNDGSSSNVAMDVVNRAYALVASRAYAMSLYYPRPGDMSMQELGQIAKNGWTSAVVKEVNRFHNHFVGQSEYLTQDSTGNLYYNERGNSGIVIVNFNDGARTVNVPVYAMADGSYTDQLTGNTFTVANGYITGQMGDYGVAIVYNPNTVVCEHTSHGTDGYCFDCYAYVGHTSGDTCTVCSTERTRIFYFKNTDSWSTVYAYSWHDSGTTVTDQWPGNKMTAISGSDGYYSITLPANATNIIFSNGSAIQTDDLTAPAGENTYDYSTGMWSVYGEASAPDYYYLQGYINGEDYYGTEFAFNNGRLMTSFTQDSYVYVQDSNGVTYMTEGWQGEVTSVDLINVEDISSDPNKLLIPAGVVVTFTLTENEDGTLNLSYVSSESSCEHPYHSTAGVCLSCGCTVVHSYVDGICSCGKYAPGSTRTVYFKNTASWATPYMYAWNSSTEYTGEWPGTAMTLVSGETNIYELTIDADAVNVVFSNGANSKTNNLTLPTNGKNLFTLSSNSWSTYTPSSTGTTSTDYYLFGYINGADYACGDDSENLGEYKFVNNTLTATFTQDSYVGIKTGDNQTWYMTHSYVTSTSGIFFTTATGASEKMLIPGGVQVTFTLKVNASGTLTLSYVADTSVTHSYTSVVTVAPGCTTAGVTTYTCSICGNSYTEAIEATGHSYSSQVTSPTCTEGGYTTYTCSVCGDSYTEEIAATGHSYSNGSCTVCGAAESGTSAVEYYLFGYINGTDYAFSDDYENMGIYLFVDGKLTATFTQDSYVGIKTGGNADWYMTQSYVDGTTGVFYDTDTGASEKMLIPGNVEVHFTLTVNGDGTLTLSYTTQAAECAHTYSATVTAQPGCTTTGVRTYTCSLCGDSYTEAIAATGHSYSAQVTAPTCTDGGYTTYTCSACGDSYTEEIAATGHSYSDGSCTICGAADPSASDVEYYLFGYINGSDYACNDDDENLGIYKFVDGTLTVCFDADSYIGVRTNDNRWYMTQSYVSGNGGIFYNTSTGASEKMLVPGGAEVTFTLTVNDNDTLTVQYTAVNACTHSYTSQVTISPSCSVHGILTYTCSLCGSSYTEQIAALGHSYVDGVCTVCGSKQTATVYYLFGYINGADYAYGDDYQNLGEYKFVDGSLTATFTQDSYVGIKTGDNLNWYLTEEYVDGTTGTFYIASDAIGEKMLIPGGVEVTFSLTVNADGSLTLSYTTEGGCSHQYKSLLTLSPGCTTEGVRTYTCTLCGFSYTEALAAAGHSYESGVCTVCGETQVQKDYYLFGYINGADYAYGDDYQNLGEYKFVDGALTATFTQDSYVGIKTGDNQSWYMTEAYVTDTTATFIITSEGTTEKMYVPGGVELTFTLTVVSDQVLTLSYEASESCEHSYGIGDTVDATCEADGEITYVCSKCGESFSEVIPSIGHEYSDGYCTVCGGRDPDAVVTPSLRLNHASLSFEDEIWYNMYYTASNLDDVTEMGLLIFDAALSDGGIDDAVQVIAGYAYDGSYYMTHTDGIAAKNMGDAMYYRVYAKLTDGSYAYSTNTVSYSAVSYASSILRKSTNSYMKALVVSMLNYGAQAQLYFGYNTDSLMNASLTEEQQALAQVYGTDTMPDPGAVDSAKNGIFANSGFGTSSITASFDAAFALNYYVNPSYTPDGAVTLYYWTEEDYASATELSPDNASGAVVMTATGTGNQYFGTISGIAAKEMGNTIYAGAVYEYNGVTCSTRVMNYSMGKYCDTIAGRETSAQRELSMAAAVYGASARDYFENL